MDRSKSEEALENIRRHHCSPLNNRFRYSNVFPTWLTESILENLYVDRYPDQCHWVTLSRFHYQSLLFIISSAPRTPITNILEILSLVIRGYSWDLQTNVCDEQAPKAGSQFLALVPRLCCGGGAGGASIIIVAAYNCVTRRAGHFSYWFSSNSAIDEVLA